MKIYIAGPMTGLSDFNYPAFHQAAATLRAAGHDVINPAENPKPACGTWQGYMRMSVAQVAAVDGIAMLPDWEHSKGANLELYIAERLGLSVMMLSDQAAKPGEETAIATAPECMNPE